MRLDQLVYDDGNTLNDNWDGFWEAKTTMTDDGWFVEVSIPLSTIGFQVDGEGRAVMGLTVTRLVSRLNERVTFPAIDPKFPGAAAFDNASFVEEWYSLKNFAPDLRVILAEDNTGMEGDMYQRPPFPQTWARMHGKGRVFYTSMGHREDVWEKPEFQALVVGAMKWSSRQIDADVTPNISHATPGADVKKEQLPATQAAW